MCFTLYLKVLHLPLKTRPIAKVISLMVIMMIARKIRIGQLVNIVAKRAIPKLFATMVIHLNNESHLSKINMSLIKQKQ